MARPAREIETVALEPEEAPPPAPAPPPPAPPEAPSVPTITPRTPLDTKGRRLLSMHLGLFRDMAKTPHFWERAIASEEEDYANRRHTAEFGAIIAAEQAELAALRAEKAAERTRLDAEIAAKQDTLRAVCQRVAVAEDLETLQHLFLQTKTDVEAAQARLAAVNAQLKEAEKALDLAHLATQIPR